MSGSEADHRAPVSVDHLSLAQVKALKDSVLVRALRRHLADPDCPSLDPLRAFSNRV